MPSEPAEPVQVEFTHEFKRNLRALARKYRHIRSDVQPMIDQLLAGEVYAIRYPGRAIQYSRCGYGTAISGKSNVLAIAWSTTSRRLQTLFL
ncbi:MAG: hypothetical protein C5S52_07095 [ANME-2 cluster archaeon]|nr:hypothetical protein [ANME-2 cluster archaeon]